MGWWWYAVESALLLLTAYFAGAWLGCIIRRLAFPNSLAADGHIAAAGAGGALATGGIRAPERWPEITPEPATDAVGRFERALTGGADLPPVDADAVTTVPLPVMRPVEPLLPRIDAIAEPTPPAPPAAEDVAPPVAPVPPVIPAPLSERIEAAAEAARHAPSLADIPGGAAASAAALAAAAATGLYRGERELPGSERYDLPTPPAEPAAPIIAAPAPSAPADDAPRAAERAAAAAAAAAATLAAATVAVAPRVIYPVAAGDGETTSFTAEITAPLAPPAAAPAPAAIIPATPPAAPPADDLTRIRGISPDVARQLTALGVSSFASIAAFDAAAVRRVNDAIGGRGRVERENWIEQAQILARGGLTHFAASETADAVILAAPGADEGTPLAPSATDADFDGGDVNSAAVASSTDLMAAEAGAAEAATVADLAAFAASPGEPPSADVLTRIYGINPDVEHRLAAEGITRFRQIAAWSDADVSRFDALVGGTGRVARENWVGQARALASLDEPLPPLAKLAPASLAVATVAPEVAGHEAAERAPVQAVEAPAAEENEAPAPRSDLAALRSVRSEALRGTDEPAPAAVDDLKRIRGVGVLVEKKLNALGVSSYEQIANWSADDVERVSGVLDFRGRIERENWIEQARILASGGQTEFSRRVDRGEVESSRTRQQD
ncbi:MAG: hypothetical protein R3D27_02295 [Hyphomicrobiaceae bacterium]